MIITLSQTDILHDLMDRYQNQLGGNSGAVVKVLRITSSPLSISLEINSVIEEELTVAGKPAIRPSIEGWAKIYGQNTITIDDDDDPYALGFQVI